MPIDTPIQLTQGQFNEEMNKIWKNHMDKPVKYTRDFGPNGDGYVVPDEGEEWYGATPIEPQRIQFTPKNFLELFVDEWKDKKSDSIGPISSARNALGAVTGGLWLEFKTPMRTKSEKESFIDWWNPSQEFEIHWINRSAKEGEAADHDEDYYRLNYYDYEFLSVGWAINKTKFVKMESPDVAKISITQNCLGLKNMNASRNIYFYLGDSLEDFNKLKVQSPHFFNWLNWMQDPMGASK